MNVFLLLSIIPGIEARGASFLLVCSNQWLLIPLAVVLNFAAVLVFIKIIDTAKLPGSIEDFLKRKMKKHTARIENWFQRYGNYAIFLLIALPSTGIGSFTGAFIGRVFGLKGTFFYSMIMLATILSIIPALLIAYGVSLFGFTCNL